MDAPTSTPPPFPGPLQPPSAPPRRPLRRDRKHRVLGGVAMGIARTYGIDVVVVRVLWIIAAVAWIGIPAYVVAWIAIPSDGGTPADDRPRDIGLLVGLALVGLGLLVAVNHLVPHGVRTGGRFAAPLFLIGGGIAILVLRRPDQTSPAFGPPAPVEDATPKEIDAPVDAPVDGTDAIDAEATPSVPARLERGSEPSSAWEQTAPWPTSRDNRAARRRERRAVRPRPFLGPLTLSVLLIGAGVVAFLEAAYEIDLDLTVLLAIATCVVGVALVLSAWLGRARGLIPLGIVLVIATGAVKTIDVPIRGGIGDRTYRPATVADVRSTYELGVGHMNLDLRALQAPLPNTGTELAIHAAVGIGQLDVEVPTGIPLSIQAHAGAGSLLLFGQQSGGWHVDRGVTVDRDGRPIPGIDLDLEVGAGQVRVRRYDRANIETLIGGSG